MPLHPALVHLPLALGVILPIVTGILMARGPRVTGLWKAVPGLQLLFVAALYAAMASGEADGELIQAAGFPKEPVEAHERLGQAALVAALVAVLPAALAVKTVPRVMLARTALLLVQVCAAVLVLWAGREGGRLVYEHLAPTFRLRALQKDQPGGGTKEGMFTPTKPVKLQE